MTVSSINLLSIKDVAEKLGVSARRVNQLIDEKKLPAHSQISGFLRFRSFYDGNSGNFEKT